MLHGHVDPLAVLPVGPSVVTQQHHTVSTPEPSENTSALCSSPRSQQRPWNLDRNWAFRMKSLESGPNPGLQDVSMNRTPPSPKQATEGDALIPCPPAPSVTHGWSRPGSLRSGARQRFPVLAGESGGWCGARGGAPRGGLEPREAGGCEETAASGVTLVRGRRAATSEPVVSAALHLSWQRLGQTLMRESEAISGLQTEGTRAGSLTGLWPASSSGHAAFPGHGCRHGGPAAAPLSCSRRHLPRSLRPHCPHPVRGPHRVRPSPASFPRRLPLCCPLSHEPLRGVQSLAHHRSPSTPTGVQPKLRARPVGLLTYG